MKKIILLTACLNVITLFAQQNDKGKVNIYLHSLICDKETTDDLFDGDGKGDEIFITVFYSVASSNGTTKYINKFTTSIYGDNRNWPARIKRGSAGNTGGIKAKDVLYLHPQTEDRMLIGDERFKGLKVIEANLDAGDILTIIPVLYEWDNNNVNTQNAFESYLWNAFNNVNIRMAGFTQRFNINSASRQFSDAGSNSINMAGISQILQGVNGVSGNRPIGMAQNGSYNPQVFVFNAPILENWMTMMQPYTREAWYNLPVYYDEPLLGNNRDHGKYSLMINPEFIKSAPAPASPVAAVNSNLSSIRKTDKTVQVNNQIKNPSLAIVGSQPIVGVWAGTQTNDYGMYPQAVSFELTANKEFIIANSKTGVVAAKGTYSFNNNILTGSYKQFSSSETYSFTGTFDSNLQKLTCTLGTGTATTGQGKLVMSKQ